MINHNIRTTEEKLNPQSQACQDLVAFAMRSTENNAELPNKKDATFKFLDGRYRKSLTEDLARKLNRFAKMLQGRKHHINMDNEHYPAITSSIPYTSLLLCPNRCFFVSTFFTPSSVPICESAADIEVWAHIKLIFKAPTLPRQ